MQEDVSVVYRKDYTINLLLALSFQTHDLETFISFLGFALLRSITLHLLVANTLMDLVEIMKTTTVVIGNFTQSLQTK